MQSKRTLWFFMTIALGAAIGLYIGWYVKPAPPAAAAAPQALRSDYRTDYVLMVAEAYRSDGSVPLAISRISYLGNTPALRLVQEAIVNGRELNYDQADIELLARLFQAFQNQPKLTPGGQK